MLHWAEDAAERGIFDFQMKNCGLNHFEGPFEMAEGVEEYDLPLGFCNASPVEKILGMMEKTALDPGGSIQRKNVEGCLRITEPTFCYFVNACFLKTNEA